MRRVFWVAVGAGAGIYLARKLTRTAESLTPQGIADRLADSIVTLGGAVRDFAAEVRAGMSEREAVLDQTLGLTQPSER